LARAAAPGRLDARAESQVLTELVRLPARIRDRGLRERGVSAFHDRYRPLVAPP
jgi:hypothetical protein